MHDKGIEMSWYKYRVTHDRNPAGEQALCRDTVARLHEVNEGILKGPMVHSEDVGTDGDIEIYFSPVAMSFCEAFALGKGATKCGPPSATKPLGNLFKVA